MPEHADVTGPHYSEHGHVSFQCTKPGCAHRTTRGADLCPAFLAWAQFCAAAISEGFCPLHQSCRLEPCDPPESGWPGLQAYGRCPRTGTVYSTGEGRDTPYSIGTWVAEDRVMPNRRALTHW